jgi:hypothetical protein
MTELRWSPWVKGRLQGCKFWDAMKSKKHLLVSIMVNATYCGHRSLLTLVQKHPLWPKYNGAETVQAVWSNDTVWHRTRDISTFKRTQEFFRKNALYDQMRNRQSRKADTDGFVCVPNCPGSDREDSSEWKVNTWNNLNTRTNHLLQEPSAPWSTLV